MSQPRTSRLVAAACCLGLAGCSVEGSPSWRPPAAERAVPARHRLDYILPAAALAWQAEASGTTEALLGVYAADPADVYAVGARGTVLASSGDGSWRPLEGGSPSDNYLAVWTLCSDEIYVAGERCPAGLCQDGVLLHSVDGGASFVTTVFPKQPLSSVWGTAAGDLYLGTEHAVLHSSDGGTTWSAAPVPVVETRLWGDGHDLYAAGGYARLDIARSGDGGDSWEPVFGQPLAKSGGLRGLWGSGDGALYAAGSRDYGEPVLLRSTDGASWTSLPTDGLVNLTAVWGSAPDNLYLAGDGALFRSGDGGLTWAPAPLAGEPSLEAVTGTGASDVYAVGLGGVIYHGR